MSLIAGPRVSLAPSSGQRVPVRTVVGGGRDTHDGHENSPILVFFSNLLVRDATADDILRLRVLDPAVGSGAFLVSACHFLSAAYERALVAEGRYDSSDINETDRAGFRRSVAQRCLFGVDRNPMAVQLARLSLWLTTLAADRPLTFLDHHLRVGDSLIGASPLDLGTP